MLWVKIDVRTPTDTDVWKLEIEMNRNCEELVVSCANGLHKAHHV